MMGHKIRTLKTYTSFSLEDLVPEDNFYRQIKAYLPIPDLSKRTEYYEPALFQYDAKQDQYICPQTHKLPLKSRRKSEEKLVYRADAKVCNGCPVKNECTGSKSGRHIFRSFHQEHIDKVKAYHLTEAYQKAMRKRGVWVDPLFGEAKEFHRLRRFRLRGLKKVNIEGIMIAAGQNLKRLIKHHLGEIYSSVNELLFQLIFTGSFTFSTACSCKARFQLARKTASCVNEMKFRFTGCSTAPTPTFSIFSAINS